MLENLMRGLDVLGSGSAIVYLVAGSVIGMVIGVVPGLGGAVVLSIVLAFIYHIDLTGTVCLFVATYAGSYYSASVTSILLNAPAHPEAFAVGLDGYPMAHRGGAGRALGLSAASTWIGGLIGCAVLLAFLPIINDLPDLFHPPEYVALVLFALLLVGSLGSESVSKAAISAGLGLMIAAIGPSNITGTFRYTFGIQALDGGVSIVALALGSFVIPQMVMLFGTGTATAREDMTGRALRSAEAVVLPEGYRRQVLSGMKEALRHRRVLLQGGLVGSLAGIVPGIGGFAGNFLSYGVARQFSRNKDQFGTGVPEGIIAAEASSLSKEAGSMIPILGLGIPGSVGGALFIAALATKNILTGLGLTDTYPVLPYEIVWVVILSSLIGTTIGVLLSSVLARVTKIPGSLYLPFIFVLAVVGPFIADVTYFDAIEVLFFGIVGFALRRLRYSLASFVIGLVLGPTLESNIYLTHRIYPGISFLSDRPLADVLFALCILVVVAKWRETRRLRQERRAAAEDPAAVAGAPDRAESGYPVLGLITTISLAVVSIIYAVYGGTHFVFAAAVMPVGAGIAVAVLTLCAIPRAVAALAADLKARQQSRPGAVSEPGQKWSILAYRWGYHGQYTRELVAFGWFVVLIAACYLFGFDWSVPAFIAVYMAVCSRRYLNTARARAIMVVLSAAGMWLLQYELLNAVHLSLTPVLHI